jgi:hypothetical protein
MMAKGETGDCLYETKCVSSLNKTISLGRGSATNGGGAPADMGHRVAFFGNTAERYRCLVYGCQERGLPELGPFNHLTGRKWVRKLGSARAIMKLHRRRILNRQTAQDKLQL